MVCSWLAVRQLLLVVVLVLWCCRANHNLLCADLFAVRATVNSEPGMTSYSSPSCTQRPAAAQASRTLRVGVLLAPLI
jgi:hypothetical protein